MRRLRTRGSTSGGASMRTAAIRAGVVRAARRAALRAAYASSVSAYGASAARRSRIASWPIGRIARAWKKLPDVAPGRSGRIKRSAAAAWASTLPCVSMPVTWRVTSVTDRMADGGSSGVLMSIAMTTSAPISRATSTGRLRSRPPSTSSHPSISIGATSPGRLMLARMRHRTERNRQGVEVLDTGRPQRQRLQYEADLLTRDETARQGDPAVLDADLDLRQIGDVVLLAAEGQVAAGRAVVEQTAPVDRPDGVLDLPRRHPGGVEPADDRAHAGAGDAVDRNAQLFERLQSADVREPARPAAAQGEADPRARPGPAGQGRGRLAGGRGVARRRAAREEQEPQAGRRPACAVPIEPAGQGWKVVVRMTVLPPRSTVTVAGSPGRSSVIFCRAVARPLGSARETPWMARTMSPPTIRSSSPMVARIVPPFRPARSAGESAAIRCTSTPTPGGGTLNTCARSPDSM